MLHYHPHSGRPCNCRYGGGEGNQRYAFVVEAADTDTELRKLRKNPDKKLNTPEGQDFLDRLEREMGAHPSGPHVKGLVPWLAHRWKKGDVMVLPQEYNPGGRNELQIVTMHPHAEGYPPISEPVSNKLPELTNWFNAAQHPLRRGFNVMEHDTPTVLNRAREHAHEMEKEAKRQRLISGGLSEHEVEHEFPDGWKIVRPTTREALEAEGQAMDHCIGRDDQPSPNMTYKDGLEQGLITPYSLRDPKGWPHLTFHTDSEGNLCQMHGYQDHNEAKQKYRGRADTWLKSQGIDHDYEVGDDNWSNTVEDRDVSYPQATTLQEYYDIHGDGDPYDYLDYDDQDWVSRYSDQYGDMPDIGYQEPHWEGIAKDFTENIDQDMDGNVALHPHHRNALNNIAEHGEMHNLDIALRNELADLQRFHENHYDVSDGMDRFDATSYSDQQNLLNERDHGDAALHMEPNEEIKAHQNALALLDRYKVPGHPGGYGQEYQTQWVHNQMLPYKDAQELNPRPYPHYMQPMFKQPQSWEPPSEDGWNYYAPFKGDFAPRRDEYAPAGVAGERNASVDKPEPLYYRWTYSPKDDKVHIRHNEMGHPVDIQTHSDIEDWLGEKGLIHGFAYKIKGGWRLTNDEHRAVDDPFISKQVIKALRDDKDTNWEDMGSMPVMHYGRRLTLD